MSVDLLNKVILLKKVSGAQLFASYAQLSQSAFVHCVRIILLYCIPLHVVRNLYIQVYSNAVVVGSWSIHLEELIKQ